MSDLRKTALQIGSNSRQPTPAQRGLDELQQRLYGPGTLPPDQGSSLVLSGQTMISEDGSFALFGARMTKTGMIVEKTLAKPEWEHIGRALAGLEGAMQWLIGDWLAYGETEYKKSYKLVAAEMGRDVDTLYNYVYVASKVNISLRNEMLTFNHHYAVAKLNADDQKMFLELAVVNDWSIAELRAAIKKAKRPAPKRQSKPEAIIKRERKTLVAKLADLADRVGEENRQFISQMLRELADEVANGEI